MKTNKKSQSVGRHVIVLMIILLVVVVVMAIIAWQTKGTMAAYLDRIFR